MIRSDILLGVGASKGITMGRAYIHKPLEVEVDKRHIDIVEAEVERFRKNLEKTIIEVDSLYRLSVENIGEREGQIFKAHKMILEDPEFIRKIEDKIKIENKNSEWSIEEVSEDFISIFKNMGNDNFKNKASDIGDVSKRLIRVSLNIKAEKIHELEGRIIVAEELTPTDIAQISSKNIRGIITSIGGKTSHIAIIAKSLEIPLITGIENATEKIKDEDFLIIDGKKGRIIIDPNIDEIINYEKKIEKIRIYKEKIKELSGTEARTLDGHRVELVGNIGNFNDIDKILKNNGDGAGLFRTEFLYINKEREPGEEEQFLIYKDAAIRLGNKPIIIRTLDFGGDKEAAYLSLPKEMNPFLGYRAIRISLDRKDIFKTQLRAIYRASIYGNVKIMFPMISSIEEIREAKKIIEVVKKELDKEKLDYNRNMEVGMMVEIPAVAIQAKHFAKEVDFFSIGTNDLIQYTVGVDRGNQYIEKLYNQYHPAVLNLIKMIIDSGHKEGIWVGMCGEVAGDEKLIPILIGMGLDEFSVSPGAINEARYFINNCSKKKMETLIDYILDLATAEEVEEYLDKNVDLKIYE